jgi:hypothetical protein
MHSTEQPLVGLYILLVHVDTCASSLCMWIRYHPVHTCMCIRDMCIRACACACGYGTTLCIRACASGSSLCMWIRYHPCTFTDTLLPSCHFISHLQTCPYQTDGGNLFNDSNISHMHISHIPMFHIRLFAYFTSAGLPLSNRWL